MFALSVLGVLLRRVAVGKKRKCKCSTERWKGPERQKDSRGCESALSRIDDKLRSGNTRLETSLKCSTSSRTSIAEACCSSQIKHCKVRNSRIYIYTMRINGCPLAAASGYCHESPDDRGLQHNCRRCCFCQTVCCDNEKNTSAARSATKNAKYDKQLIYTFYTIINYKAFR